MLDEGRSPREIPALVRPPAAAIRHGRLVRRLVIAAAGSVLFTLALVPFYNVLCRATGLNGRTGNDSFQPGGLNPGLRQAFNRIDYRRTVTVQFTGTVMPGLPWDIRPLTRSIAVHPGELQVIEYLVRNRSPEPVTGQAIPGVSPGQAARYFNKIECFCFAHQSMEPFEERKMAVAFTIRPDLDPEVSELTLAYAFFPLRFARIATVSGRPAIPSGIRS